MAVLTILMTGAAHRQAVDPAPPAAHDQETPVPCQNLPACRAWDRVTLVTQPSSGAGERSAADMAPVLAQKSGRRCHSEQVDLARQASCCGRAGKDR